MAFDKTQGAYTALRDQVAERTRPLVAWVGAGLSAAAGLPTWQELKESIVHAGLSKARSMERVDRTNLEKRIDSAVREPNLWKAFSILRDQVGTTTFHDEIRRALGEAPRVRIPDTYRNIWELPIRGVINLNIDRIATRAFHDLRADSLPHEFTADQMGGMTHVLTSVRPFIVNLHGNVEQVSTWVFTLSDLSRLQKSPANVNFIRTCISTNSILFLGITTDDRAVGGHLEWFAKNGINTGPHFWLTDRRDRDTDEWAEQADIRVIRYANADGKHAEVQEFFKDLLAYVPQEDTRALAPVILETQSEAVGVSIPDPASLVREDTETIRQLLNSKARELLSRDVSDSYAKFEKFCSEYDEAIHRAWYVNTTEGRNRLLGYQLVEMVARGAFGQVYRAIDAEGSQVAIKLLHEEIRANADLLRSFRRGIRSMRILQKRHALGMVEFKDASEIPAFVAMEWIDGPNLAEAIKGKHIGNWDEILRVGRDLATIIGRAHALPERVLHRDLRPANIMLKGYYEDPLNYEVVVLDFDLSWHKGAFERSVLHSTAMGYLAPEQIAFRPSVSTRHAAVDSYGFGMTLFFMCTGREPIAEQHKHRDWQKVLDVEIASRKCPSWRSLPKRVARLVYMTTQDEQSKRLDMGQINSEIARLYDALIDASKIVSVELIAEEIATRAEYLSGYTWIADRGAAVFKTPSGLTIGVAADETTKTVEATIAWERTGMEDRKRTSELVTGGVERAAQKLSAGGWRIDRKEPRMGGFLVRASVDRGEALAALSKLAAALDGACEQVRVN